MCAVQHATLQLLARSAGRSASGSACEAPPSRRPEVLFDVQMIRKRFGQRGDQMARFGAIVGRAMKRMAPASSVFPPNALSGPVERIDGAPARRRAGRASDDSYARVACVLSAYGGVVSRGERGERVKGLSHGSRSDVADEIWSTDTGGSPKRKASPQVGTATPRLSPTVAGRSTTSGSLPVVSVDAAAHPTATRTRATTAARRLMGRPYDEPPQRP